MFTEMENLHIKVGRIIHKILKKYLDHEVLDLIVTNVCAYYQTPSLDFDIRGMSHLCVRTIRTVCIKVDQLLH